MRNKNKENTSILICTLNEGKTIEHVVESCCKYNDGSEVIVIDDGSTDATEEIMRELQKTFSFVYEKLPQNMGKSWAMVRGVEMSSNDVILFFDADILNVKEVHFEELLNPIYNSSTDMVLGQPSDTLLNHRINPFRSLSGQRALLKKDILPILNDIREIRFGVETFINLYFKANGKDIHYVFLEGIKNPTKYEKTTPLEATKEYLHEGQEIATTVIENYDLITQRIEYMIKNNNDHIKDVIVKLQKKLIKSWNN